VLPIGGLKEKVLAAHRAGIKTILVPLENEKDIPEIPAAIVKSLRLELVEHMDDVLRKALNVPDPENFLRGEAADPLAKPVPSIAPAEPTGPNVIAH
jgi:ATP-dependent Lon protease